MKAFDYIKSYIAVAELWLTAPILVVLASFGVYLDNKNQTALANEKQLLMTQVEMLNQQHAQELEDLKNKNQLSLADVQLQIDTQNAKDDIENCEQFNKTFDAKKAVHNKKLKVLKRIVGKWSQKIKKFAQVNRPGMVSGSAENLRYYFKNSEDLFLADLKKEQNRRYNICHGTLSASHERTLLVLHPTTPSITVDNGGPVTWEFSPNLIGLKSDEKYIDINVTSLTIDKNFGVFMTVDRPLKHSRFCSNSQVMLVREGPNAYELPKQTNFFISVWVRREKLRVNSLHCALGTGFGENQNSDTEIAIFPGGTKVVHNE